MTRSGYRNRIPRDRSQSGTGHGGSPKAAPPRTGTKGRKAAQTKGPRQVAWGGEGEPARGAPHEKPPRDRCGRAEGGAGRRRTRPAPSAARGCRGPSHFPPPDRDPLAEPRARPEPKKRPQPTPVTSRSLSLARRTHRGRRHRLLSLHSSFPGNPTWPAGHQRLPEPSAPGGVQTEGAGQ